MLSISPLNQFLIALRFYATGCFLRVSGDLFGVHESTASRIVRRVSHVLSSLYKENILLANHSSIVLLIFNYVFARTN